MIIRTIAYDQAEEATTDFILFLFLYRICHQVALQLALRFVLMLVEESGKCSADSATSLGIKVPVWAFTAEFDRP